MFKNVHMEKTSTNNFIIIIHSLIHYYHNRNDNHKPNKDVEDTQPTNKQTMQKK